jgi:hypothetical protein
MRRLGVLWAVLIGALLHYVCTPLFMLEANIYWYLYGEYLNALAGDRELLSLVARDDWAAIIRRYRLDYIVAFFPTAAVRKIPPALIIFKSDAYTYTEQAKMLIVDSAYWNKSQVPAVSMESPIVQR